MKILPVEWIRKADHYTTENEPIASIDLMERAAWACSEWILKNILPDFPVLISCGSGNNGGDGLAVARHLSRQGYTVRVFLLKTNARPSVDNQMNFERLQKEGLVRIDEIRSEEDFPMIQHRCCVVDALYGTGLSRPLEGLEAQWIHHLNASPSFRVAIDIPSGLFADSSTRVAGGIAFQADVTLSFAPPKLCFMMAENEVFTGEWVMLDIGLDKPFIEQADSMNFFTLKEEMHPHLLQRRRFAHKGNFGHALLMAGSEGKAGAALLAARACLHSGAGLLTVHTPSKPASAMQSAFPEAMVSIDDDEACLSRLPDVSRFTAIAIGPGIGTGKQTAQVVKLLIQQFRGPVVYDADALNILSENKTWLSFLTPGSILTPHPKEFERLCGAPSDDFDRLGKAREFARRYSVFVILKGGYTAVLLPNGECHFNSTGNPGMATAGSGDVLTGILLGLLARGYDRYTACRLGVLLHGMAGDHAAGVLGMEYMTAGDLISSLSQAFLELEKGTERKGFGSHP